MRIATTSADGTSVEMYRRYDVGCMIPTPCKSNLSAIRKSAPWFALDNGAWGCYRRGVPFQRESFRRAVGKVYDAGVVLEFLACPDILRAGMDSLEWSLEWAHGELRGTRDLALVVQPGMTPARIRWSLKPFTWIFVGGGTDWRWDTLPDWVSAAREWGMRIHVGQVGTLEGLLRCSAAGVDSVDSSSYMRNKSWHIIEQYRAIEATEQLR